MSYKKNTSSQKFNVLAVNTSTSLPITGDSANITAKISIDSGAFASLADTNPTELDATNAPGVYVFDLSQAETNGDVLTIIPSSTTANVQIDILNIYTVDLATYKADVSGLATAISLGVTDGKCTSILTDTGTTIPAQITGLNNFDPASDTVANVTLVATTTTNTDMRGTDNAAAASSLSITNSSVNTIKAVTNNLPDSGALSSLATASDLATVDTVVDAILVDTGTTIPAQITGLNNLDAAGVRSAIGLASANLDTQIADLPTVAEFEARTLVAAAYFDPASDAVANVTLCDTTTTNTDMRGTNNAALASSLSITNSSVNTIKAVTNNLPDSGALTSLATASDLATVDTVVDAILVDTGTTIPSQITALNNLDAAGVRSAVRLASADFDTQLGDIPTVSEFEARTLVASAYFDPVSDAVANVTLVGTCTTNTDMRGTDNAAAASSLAITNSSVNTIKTVTNNLPDSGALTSLATASDLATVDTVVDAILIDTGTTIPAQITGLNDIDAAGVRSAVGLASANLDTQIADLPTVAEFEARTIVASAYFDPASDVVANVTLVDTTTTNTDMRGTDAANTVAPANSDVAAIKAKTDQFVFTVANQVDANALTGGTSSADIYTYFTDGTREDAFKATGFNTVAPDNASITAILTDTGTTIPAQITGLNNFDPATDVVANVTLVDTTTTNTDMVGTNNAALASSLSITNSSVNAIKTVTNALPDSGALSSLATASDLATVDTVVDAILVDTGATIPAQITGLNNLDAAGVRSAVGLASANLDTQIADLPTVAEFEARTLVAAAYFDPSADAVANVTLVGTTTTNTDMRGTDSANTVAPANSDITAIKAKTDQFVFTVSNQVDANALTGGGGDDAATIYTYFTAGANEDAFKADVTALATSSSIAALNDFDPSSDTVANVTLVGTTTTNTDMRGTDSANTVAPANSDITAIKTKTDQFVFTVANQVDSNALTGGGGDDAATIYTYFTSGTNENAFKADVSSLATSSALATVDLNVDAILVDTNTTIPSQISGLNDFNPATETVANVSNVALVSTTTTNTDMRGTDGANTTTPPSVSSIVSGISAETYDGVAFEDVMKVLLSMAQGKIVESSSGVFEFYAQDDATVLYTLTKSGNQRNRS